MQSCHVKHRRLFAVVVYIQCVHTVPVWSVGVVPSPGNELTGARGTVKKNYLHIYFLFLHLNYLCDFFCSYAVAIIVV